MRTISYLLTITLMLLFGSVNVSSQTVPPSRVMVRIVTDEADAVLQILARKEASQEITEADWQKVFSSEGYVRLKQRELSMQRPFEEADFKKFVLSDDLLSRRSALADTLARWKNADVGKLAELPLAYLPETAHIKARIYPVIKPRENSFVFGIPEDPAIFMYLDPAKSKELFENHLAHELHHIGFGTACPTAKTNEEAKKLPPDVQRMLKWIGAFGEGFAMLAAAGGPDVDPHRFSAGEDQERWKKDVANFNNDLRTVEKFFLNLSGGKLSEKEETEKAYSFYGVQGPWYTVGWKMAVVIEKTLGRPTLIEVMCDQRKLLATYNKAVKQYNSRNHENLTLWSDELVDKLK